MNDPYRITDTPARAADQPRGRLRPLLWLALVLSAAANMVLSMITSRPAVSSAFGAVALACAVALVVQHYRNRDAGTTS
jgi:hypothetical protein